MSLTESRTYGRSGPIAGPGVGRHLLIVDDDDRIRCTDCSWLSKSGVCRAAGPKNKPVVANRGYQPVRDLPRRCEGFAPYADHPDQRRGLERWPGLAAFHSFNATPPGAEGGKPMETHR